MSNYQQTPFHLVDPSPWPIVSAFGALTLTSGTVMYMHNYKGGFSTLFLGLFTLILTGGVWFRDIVRESTFEGNHTSMVQLGLRFGMVLFIVSEIMFFFGFFWAFFDSSLAPCIEIGAVWPPKGIDVFNPWELPFLNTLILLLSGVSVTWAHHAILVGNRRQSIISLFITIFLAKLFTICQVYEYIHASFTLSDGIYGSTFYLTTGFHGFHVFVGTYMLLVATIRLIKYHYTLTNHFGFEAAAWYWHFVDVVWLFLFVCVYWWGGN